MVKIAKGCLKDKNMKQDKIVKYIAKQVKCLLLKGADEIHILKQGEGYAVNSRTKVRKEESQ